MDGNCYMGASWSCLLAETSPEAPCIQDAEPGGAGTTGARIGFVPYRKLAKDKLNRWLAYARDAFDNLPASIGAQTDRGA